ncbi:MAG: MFS transporter, partial [Candidatus Paceibacterota bacterium]
MLQRIFAYYQATPAIKKISHFTLLATLVFLADASLAYFIPNYIESTFNSSIVMGLVMSTSSLVGLGADIVLPQLLPRLTVKRALLLTSIFQLTFIGTLLISLLHPKLWLFFLAMACWGLYFEFLTFSAKIFVTKKVPHPMNSVAWANIMFGRSLSYVAGPVVVTALIFRGNLTVLLTVLAISLLAQLISLIFPIKITPLEQQEENTVKMPYPLKEFRRWKILSKADWPSLV